MKKTVLTIGLFTLVLASTSFATPTISTSPIGDNTITASIDGNGSQDSGDNRKLDFTENSLGATSAANVNDIDGNGSQDSGDNRKLD